MLSPLLYNSHFADDDKLVGRMGLGVVILVQYLNRLVEHMDGHDGPLAHFVFFVRAATG